MYRVSLIYNDCVKRCPVICRDCNPSLMATGLRRAENYKLRQPQSVIASRTVESAEIKKMQQESRSKRHELRCALFSMKVPS